MKLRKIAFFVEGYTEQKFLECLITQIFTRSDIAIEIRKMTGGSRVRTTIFTVVTATITPTTKYFILIYNCGGDSNVRSYLEDQRVSLIKNGYEKIIGWRDVFPLLHADIPKLLRGLLFKVPQAPIPISFIISVMEVEAWFLAEITHYQKIHANLTPALINSNLGVDVVNGNMEDRLNPANDLNNIYQLVGELYTKSAPKIDRTVNSLDFANVYLDLPAKFPSLRNLISEIEALFQAN